MHWTLITLDNVKFTYVSNPPPRPPTNGDLYNSFKNSHGFYRLRLTKIITIVKTDIVYIALG